MGEESNGRFNDQENMKRIRENDAIKNVLLHQLCSEMLTMKKQIKDLQAEVKLNQLRHEDEMGDAYANIAILMKRTDQHAQMLGFGENEQNMTDKEKAIKDLNTKLFGKEKNG